MRFSYLSSLTMPEGPESRLNAEELQSIIANSIILNWYIAKPEHIFGTELLSLNAQILRVNAYGKKILFQLSNDIYFYTSQHMEGKWRFEMQPHTWIAFHLRLANGQEITLSFQDHRYMAEFVICSKLEFEQRMSQLGIDLLTQDMSLETFIQFLRRHQRKNICAFLLAQDEFCGIGNYLKCDILYASRISPHRTCGSLNDTEIISLHTNLHAIPRYSYACGAITLYTWKSISGRTGTYTPLVYGRDTTNEGYPVVKEMIQSRITYYCPSLQC